MVSLSSKSPQNTKRNSQFQISLTIQIGSTSHFKRLPFVLHGMNIWYLLSHRAWWRTGVMRSISLKPCVSLVIVAPTPRNSDVVRVRLQIIGPSIGCLVLAGNIRDSSPRLVSYIVGVQQSILHWLIELSSSVSVENNGSV